MVVAVLPPRIAVLVKIDLAVERAIGSRCPEIAVFGVVADRLSVIRIKRNCRDAIGDKLGKCRAIAYPTSGVPPASFRETASCA